MMEMFNGKSSPRPVGGAGQESIAIVGIGCRFPGADGPEAFWRLLRDGVDATTEIPESRFDIDEWYDPRPGVPGKITTRLGGFLEQVDQFDPYFFGISAREAMEDAGLALDKLDKAGSTTMLAVPEAAQEVAGWQVQAIYEYERTLAAMRVDLREELAARILVLTGRRVSPEDAYADGRLAVAGVDGTTFRLYRHGPLVVVRACAYCETGRFESPEVTDLADLGYTLSSSAWRPLHEECEDYEDHDVSENLADW